jgi:hypothetical protein
MAWPSANLLGMTAASADTPVMLDDDDTTELVAACLADAAASECSAEDLRLTATALARDLSDMLADEPAEVLAAAVPLAIIYLDESDLEAGPFASALGQLHQLHELHGRRSRRRPGPAFVLPDESGPMAA